MRCLQAILPVFVPLYCHFSVIDAGVARHARRLAKWTTLSFSLERVLIFIVACAKVLARSWTGFLWYPSLLLFPYFTSFILTSFDTVLIRLKYHISLRIVIFFDFEGFLELSLISLRAHSFHYTDSLRQILLLERCVWVFGLKDLLDSAFIELGLLLWQMVLITLCSTTRAWYSMCIRHEAVFKC